MTDKNYQSKRTSYYNEKSLLNLIYWDKYDFILDVQINSFVVDKNSGSDMYYSNDKAECTNNVKFKDRTKNNMIPESSPLSWISNIVTLTPTLVESIDPWRIGPYEYLIDTV